MVFFWCFFFGVFFLLLFFLRGFCLSVNQDASNLIPLTDGQPNRSSGEGLIYFTSGKKLCSSGHDFKPVPDSFFFFFKEKIETMVIFH